MPPPVFRFAPSPNGNLHLGHALSALLNFDLAQRACGSFLLRIEDIDAARCRPEYETAIGEDLAWLGIVWDKPVRRQSEHLSDYATAIGRLAEQGLIYRSFESRAELARRVAEHAGDPPWPRDPDGVPVFRGAPLAPTAEQRMVEAGAPFVWRLDIEKACARTGALAWIETGDAPGVAQGAVPADPAAWGDVVLARRDTPTSYHLSVVIDDALQGVTDVVRGADLYHATSVHRLLQALLDLPQPRYRHHALILDDHGQKLSKSNRATALRELRGSGVTPADIRRRLRLPAA